MPPTFEPQLLDDLRTREEIDIETRSPRGDVHRTTIWVVVDGDEVYVRSVQGEEGRWYRELMTTREGAILLPDRVVRILAEPVTDVAAMERVSEGYRTKYATSPHRDSMLREEILTTTLKLEPR